jgi:predicted CopG family antitoxin
MANVTISISKEAYDALMRQRNGNESLTETILRLVKNGRLADGKRQMAGKENRDFSRDSADGWYTSQDLL